MYSMYTLISLYVYRARLDPIMFWVGLTMRLLPIGKRKKNKTKKPLLKY